MKEIEKLSESHKDLLILEENITEALSFIQKAQAVLSAIGLTLFESESTDPFDVALHYDNAKQLYFTAKDNLDNAIELLA